MVWGAKRERRWVWTVAWGNRRDGTGWTLGRGGGGGWGGWGWMVEGTGGRAEGKREGAEEERCRGEGLVGGGGSVVAGGDEGGEEGGGRGLVAGV